MAARIERSGFLAELVQPAVIDAVVSDPAAQWRLTWLLGNLALWSDAALDAAPMERRAA